MLSLLLDVGLDDSRLVDGTGSHTLDALERSADIHIWVVYVSRIWLLVYHQSLYINVFSFVSSMIACV